MAVQDTSEDRLLLRVACGPLAGPIVARVVGIAAARADLPVDRVEQALQVADAVTSEVAGLLVGDRLEIAIDQQDAGIRMHVAPLRSDGARRLAEEAANGSVIGMFATWTGVEVRDDRSEALIIDIGSFARDGGR